MPHQGLAAHKQIRRPPGCEGHLTRREAACLLGFASEFKVRDFERQGLLRSVRGPMRTAFYPRPQVLALKARLAQAVGQAPTDWTDADLIALLENPSPAGQPRTAVDLVTEARISIERAERVYAFWSKAAPPTRTAPVGAAAHAPLARATAPLAHSTRPPAGERRGDDRVARDRLIRELRDPDPRVRQQAFERLRESRSPRIG